MKNVYCYWAPTGKIAEAHEFLLRLNVANSLRLGWTPEQILVYTNFPWEYKGTKALPLGDVNYDASVWTKERWAVQSFKVFFLKYAYEQGLMDDAWWYHDIDLFQMTTFFEPPQDLNKEAIALLSKHSARSGHHIYSASMFSTNRFGEQLSRLWRPGFTHDEEFLQFVRSECGQEQIPMLPRGWCLCSDPTKRRLNANHKMMGSGVKSVQCVHFNPTWLDRSGVDSWYSHLGSNEFSWRILTGGFVKLAQEFGLAKGVVI